MRRISTQRGVELAFLVVCAACASEGGGVSPANTALEPNQNSASAESDQSAVSDQNAGSSASSGQAASQDSTAAGTSSAGSLEPAPSTAQGDAEIPAQSEGLAEPVEGADLAGAAPDALPAQPGVEDSAPPGAASPDEATEQPDPVAETPATDPADEPSALDPVGELPESEPAPTETSVADRASVAGTCQRWDADRADLSEGEWSGDLATCEVGDISAQGRDNALRLVNLYRWLADLPEVQTDPERNRLAQACALLMHANANLSHDPPEDWQCYSADGAQGARTSNISGGPGVSSVEGYLVDRGNESTMGHRRIILSNSFGPIGLGSTGARGYSCMQNNYGTGNAGKAWQAWPPPGVFPIQAYGNRFASLSDTGWSLQSERIELAGATVTVSLGGAAVDVSVEPLMGRYGGADGIRIAPVGWEPQAGSRVEVTVSGVEPPIAYAIDFVDCAAP